VKIDSPKKKKNALSMKIAPPKKASCRRALESGAKFVQGVKIDSPEKKNALSMKIACQNK